MSATYTVRSGDTLGAIAARNGTTVQDLKRANGITDPNRISIGQVLSLPGSDTATSASTSDAASSGSWATTVLRFVDAIGRPIADKLVRLVSSEGTEIRGRTDANGCSPKISCRQPNARLDIHIERAEHKGGGEKHIASYKPSAGAQTIKVQSGKQVETTRIRRHEGQPQTPPAKMKSQLPGTKLETATGGGNPLTCVKCGECPNDDNLKLDANLEFKAYVMTAAKRAGVIPQAVAAVMNAEAAKDKSGKWKADSKSTKSSATGMTQFLDGTWVGETLRAGTYLNDQAKKEGWLCQDAKGNWQFKKADGTFVTGPGLAAKLTAKTMITSARTAADGNLQKLLDLREQAEYAIMAAMDYASHNLQCLKDKGYDIDGLNDTEKARIMYLCHHLGLGDAVHFIQNEIPEDDVFVEDKKGKKRLKQNGAKKLLAAQVGEVAALKEYVKPNGNSWVKGHRRWLQKFISDHIKPSISTCAGDALSGAQREESKAELLDVVESLKK